MRTIRDLENKDVLLTLLFLSENGRCKASAIYKGARGSYSTLCRALNILLQLGLISEEREHPSIRYIQLTDGGKMIARKIAEINLLLDTYKRAEK